VVIVKLFFKPRLLLIIINVILLMILGILLILRGVWYCCYLRVSPLIVRAFHVNVSILV
jgi:hypothetical protein